MRAYVISPNINWKLDNKHATGEKEIDECFENKCGIYLIDNREDHKSDPPTLWFVAETNLGRLLKVIFIYRDGKHFIRSAYEANDIEIDIYERKGK